MNIAGINWPYKRLTTLLLVCLVMMTYLNYAAKRVTLLVGNASYANLVR